jgi:hypothetical protein
LHCRHSQPAESSTILARSGSKLHGSLRLLDWKSRWGAAMPLVNNMTLILGLANLHNQTIILMVLARRRRPTNDHRFSCSSALSGIFGIKAAVPAHVSGGRTTQ